MEKLQNIFIDKSLLEAWYLTQNIRDKDYIMCGNLQLEKKSSHGSYTLERFCRKCHLYISLLGRDISNNSFSRVPHV